MREKERGVCRLPFQHLHKEPSVGLVNIDFIFDPAIKILQSALPVAAADKAISMVERFCSVACQLGVQLLCVGFPCQRQIYLDRREILMQHAARQCKHEKRRVHRSSSCQYKGRIENNEIPDQNGYCGNDQRNHQINAATGLYKDEYCCRIEALDWRMCHGENGHRCGKQEKNEHARHQRGRKRQVPGQKIFSHYHEAEEYERKQAPKVFKPINELDTDSWCLLALRPRFQQNQEVSEVYRQYDSAQEDTKQSHSFNKHFKDKKSNHGEDDADIRQRIQNLPDDFPGSQLRRSASSLSCRCGTGS